ncbi:MAG: serine hydrolase [Bacteroidales bacterium]
MKTKKLLFTGLVMCSLAASAPQGQAQSPASDPAGAVEKIVRDYNDAETPGGVVLVMRGGQVVYRKAFGMANLTHGIPFEATTPTNIGSSSKQFTGFAIALLEERGKLSLNDDVRKHIPELPDLGHKVSLLHLLSHTSGYREFFNSLAMTGMHPKSIRREYIIPVVQRQPSLQNVPGDSWMYNNTGYALLAVVVERVTGQPFPEWMEENIFQPLEMNNTLVREDPGQVIKGSAQGYAFRPEEGFREESDIGGAMGAGGIYTTVDDLAKWVNNFFEPRLGSRALIEKMQTPLFLNNGDPTGYGLGLIIDELNGLKRWQHGGSDAAHRSQLMIFPAIQGAVITQSNNAAFPNEAAARIAEAFFSDAMNSGISQEEPIEATGPIVYKAEKFDKISGHYELEAAPGFILEFSREGEQLFAQATGQQRFEIFASSDTTFFWEVVPASLTFHRNEAGEFESLTLHQNGNHRGKRVSRQAWEPSAEDVAQYLGRYFSEELETFYTVAVNEKGDFFLKNRQLQDIPLQAGDKDEFNGAFPIMGLQFVRDEAGNVTGFKASSGRSFGILFEKTD